MPDLYAINIHLQERLEQDGCEEVRAVEAARWLDKAGLLRNYNNGLPLRRLLRAGRIAGQEQRPNQKNGAWFIRRLAASRDPRAIRASRARLRRCLPIDRNALPPDWPVNQGPAVFWQELGKTVAAFGYLEHILASTCHALLATGERAVALLETNDDAAMRQWTKRLLRSKTDTMHLLTRELDRVLDEAGLVPHAVREELVARLDELRPWRNALCHGAWISVADDGSARLDHVYRYEGLPAGFKRDFTVKDPFRHSRPHGRYHHTHPRSRPPSPGPSTPIWAAPATPSPPSCHACTNPRNAPLPNRTCCARPGGAVERDDTLWPGEAHPAPWRRSISTGSR